MLCCVRELEGRMMKRTKGMMIWLSVTESEAPCHLADEGRISVPVGGLLREHVWID